MAKSGKAKLKAVLVGCGGMSRAWLEPASKRADLQLVGLVDLRLEAAQTRAAEYHLPAEVAFTDLQAALKATEPDVVFDVTIPEAHHGVALTALKHGCHILGEKPMSTTLAHARQMVAAADRAQRIYAVIQNRRYEPNIRRARQVLQSGKLGAVEEVHSDFYLGPHFGGFRDEMAHPLLVDMAIHTFDQCRYLTGADPVAVYCHAFNPPRSWYQGDASAVAIFEMKLPDGKPVVYCYRGSWCAQGEQTSWNANWRVVCNQGTLRWDGAEDVRAEVVPARAKRQFFKQLKPVKAPAVKVPHLGHAGLIDDFLRAVRTGGKPLTDCHDNIRSFAMVVAAVKSAASGRRELVKW